MPFTLSHTVAVLPLRTLRQLNFTALVIGSMACDFGYFTAFPWRWCLLMHRPHGSLYISLPFAIAVFALLAWLREEIKLTLPGGFRNFFERARLLDFDWRAGGPIIIILSLAIGVATHVVWDAFTHTWGFGVNWVPALRDLLALGPFDLPRYRWLQHTSSVVGLALLFAFTLRGLTRERSLKEVLLRNEDAWAHALWLGLFSGPALISFTSQLLPVILGIKESGRVEILLFNIITTFFTSFAFIYLIILLFLKSRKKVARILARL